MQNTQEPEKQKVLKYYVTLCSLMIQQVHNIQTPEVFSVCQTNKALFIKVVSKQQLFSASQTDTHDARKQLFFTMRQWPRSDNENDN